MQERNNRRNKKKEKLKKKSGTITGRHLVAVWASFFLSVSVIPSSISCQSSEHSSHLVAALTCRASFHLFRDGEREFHQSGQRRNGIGFFFSQQRQIRCNIYPNRERRNGLLSSGRVQRTTTEVWKKSGTITADGPESTKVFHVAFVRTRQ